MSEIKLIKTPWYKMIKINKRCRKWNKKYGNRPLTMDETIKALAEWQNDD